MLLRVFFKRHLSQATKPPRNCIRPPLSYTSTAFCRSYAQSSPPPGRPLPAHVQRQQAIDATRSLPKLTLDEFELLAAKGTAAVEQARACLYQLKNELLPLPLAERQEKCLEYEAGKRILLWYWRQREAAQPTPDRLFANLTTWFLVAEKRDDFVFQWLNGEVRLLDDNDLSKDPHQESMRELVDWGHLWLAGIGSAHLEWSANKSPVKTLQCFERALNGFSKHIRPGCSGLLTGLCVAAEQAVVNHESLPYDDELWDVYFEGFARLVNNRTVLSERQATAHLFHPSKADGVPFYTLTKERGSVQTTRLRSARADARIAYSTRALRAIFIMRWQGHVDKAELLLQDLEAQHPAFVTRFGHKVYRQCSLDPKLKKLRSSANINDDYDFLKRISPDKSEWRSVTSRTE